MQPMPMPPMGMVPMGMPPMGMPPMQPHQHRFFHNNNNNHSFHNFDNQNRFRPSHYNQQRPAQMYQFPPQQQQPLIPGPNPFIPLQASRKATKAKSNMSETKILPQQKQTVTKQKETTNLKEKEREVSQIETVSNSVGSSPPAIDNRKCRLAISFGK